MTTDTVIAKIQVRRGQLDDLPILDNGELGYATDVNRLFIGNANATFNADGVTRSFLLRDAVIIPGQVRILVDGVESIYGVSSGPGPGNFYFQIDGTSIVFDRAPADQAVITVSYNSEIQIQRNFREKEVELLNTTGANFAKTSISWDLLTYNSAKLTYSYKVDNNFAIGELYIITNGTEIFVKDVSTHNYIYFNGQIENGRFFITYKNEVGSANLFYNIELWNTV